MMALSSISPSTSKGSPLTMIINPLILIEKLSCTYYSVDSHCEYDIGETHIPFSKSPEWNLGLGEGLLRKQSFMKHQVLLQVLVPTEFSSSPEARGFSQAESSGEEAWAGLWKHCLSVLLAGENSVPPEHQPPLWCFPGSCCQVLTVESRHESESSFILRITSLCVPPWSNPKPKAFACKDGVLCLGRPKFLRMIKTNL